LKFFPFILTFYFSCFADNNPTEWKPFWMILSFSQIRRDYCRENISHVKDWCIKITGKMALLCPQFYAGSIGKVGTDLLGSGSVSGSGCSPKTFYSGASPLLNWKLETYGSEKIWLWRQRPPVRPAAQTIASIGRGKAKKKDRKEWRTERVNEGRKEGGRSFTLNVSWIYLIRVRVWRGLVKSNFITTGFLFLFAL